MPRKQTPEEEPKEEEPKEDKPARTDQAWQVAEDANDQREIIKALRKVFRW